MLAVEGRTGPGRRRRARYAIENTFKENARRALERVCSATSFVDHVNGLEFHGLAGPERSVQLYRRLLSEMTIVVEDQQVEGERVASRFVVRGRCLGRNVKFNGITISRFENGLIAEDWSVTDTLGMLRQVGVLRSIVMGLRAAGTLLRGARSA